MISRLEASQETIIAHLAQISLKSTKNFTHGGIVFDERAGSVTFGSLAAVALPAGFALADGKEVNLYLAGPDGKLRKQTRTGILRKAKDAGIYRITGLAKTPNLFSAEDGWTIVVYRFRAYFTHPGFSMSGGIPGWLKESIARQRNFWNRMSWLCRDARRKCSPMPVGEIKAFAAEFIFPAIDELNMSLGRASKKVKMTYPPKLKIEEPGLDGLWNFVGMLRKRMETGLPVPAGLLDRTVAFAEGFKPDYTPINDFLANVQAIGEREAKSLEMLPVEFRPAMKRFLAVLKLRKSKKVAWSDGWPMIRYADSPHADDWQLTYYFNKAGVMTSDLETYKGVPGLTFARPKSQRETGAHFGGYHARHRVLRAATISMPGSRNHEREFNFIIQQSRPLPEGSHIKQWQLSEKDGKLWLNLTLEIKRDAAVRIAAPGDAAAGLDIGWRRTPEGVRIGVVYEPAGKTYKEVTLDFERSPKDPTERVPFRLDLGPNRWEKRNVERLIPDWKESDGIPAGVELRSILSSRRSALKDTAKARLRKHLGEQVPEWFSKAGKRGLIRLAADLKDDATVQEIVANLVQKTDELNRLAAEYTEKSTRRLDYGYQQIAHDIAKHVQAKGLNLIAVEKEFLAKMAKQEPDPAGDGYWALRNSQKYRQFAAVGKFVAILKMIAAKYGIGMVEVDAANTTRLCADCGHVNSPTPKQRYQCDGCQRLVDQDMNAAVNISRAAVETGSPEMAMA